jgi:hypothetical protein
MTRFSHVALLGLAFSWLAACSSPPAPAPAQAANPAPPRESLNRLVERYWDERADPDAALSVQSLADSLAVERRFLARRSTRSRS